MLPKAITFTPPALGTTLVEGSRWPVVSVVRVWVLPVVGSVLCASAGAAAIMATPAKRVDAMRRLRVVLMFDSVPNTVRARPTCAI